MGRDEITSPYKPSLSVARGGVERSLRPSISSPVAGFLRIMAWANRSMVVRSPSSPLGSAAGVHLRAPGGRVITSNNQ